MSWEAQMPSSKTWFVFFFCSAHQSVGVKNPISSTGLYEEPLLQLPLEDELLEEGVLPILAVVVAGRVLRVWLDHGLVVPLQLDFFHEVWWLIHGLPLKTDDGGSALWCPSTALQNPWAKYDLCLGWEYFEQETSAKSHNHLQECVIHAGIFIRPRGPQYLCPTYSQSWLWWFLKFCLTKTQKASISKVEQPFENLIS